VSEPEKNINLSFRVTEARQEELKIFSARRRQSIQAMLEEGLELLLKEPRKSDPPSPTPPNLGQQFLAVIRWHKMLSFILRARGSKAEEAQSAVKSNLSVFYHHCGGKDKDLEESPVTKKKVD